MTADTRGFGLRLGLSLARLAALAVITGLLVSYPIFLQRLGVERFVEQAVFHLAYMLTLAATALCAFRVRVLWETVVEGVRSAPLLSALLLLNTSVFVILVLSVFTQAGLLALMFLGSLLASVFLLSSDSRRERLTSELLRASPLAFASIYLCLGAGEIFLRFHPELVGGGGGGNPALRRLYSGLYFSNSFGLRDDEFQRSRPAGTYRILSLGDSFTFGQGVGHNDTYPQQMESLLNADRDTLRYEVINAGASGANTVAELNYLRQEGLSFEPNLVTVQFYLNDIEPRFEGEVANANWLIDNLVKRPFRTSYVVFFLRYRFDRFLESIARLIYGDAEHGDYLSGLVDSVERGDLGWQQFTAALDDLATQSRQTGTPIAIVVFPNPGRPGDEQTRKINRAVADYSKRAGLHVIDLTDAFGDIPPEEQVVSEIDHHPSVSLHRAAAEKIVESLRQRGLLPTQHRNG